MIVGPTPIWSNTQYPTLVDGEIVYPDLHVLRPLVNLDDVGYDNTKEST